METLFLISTLGSLIWMGLYFHERRKRINRENQIMVIVYRAQGVIESMEASDYIDKLLREAEENSKKHFS